MIGAIDNRVAWCVVAIVLGGCSPKPATPELTAAEAAPAAKYLQAELACAENPRCDVDENGVCNAGDILIIRGAANWNRRVCDEPDPTPTPTPQPITMQEVNHGVTIESGKTYRNLIIRPRDGENGLWVPAGRVAVDVTIDNVVIDGGEIGLGCTRAPTPPQCGRWTVSNLTIRNTARQAVYAGLFDSTFTDCTIADSGSHVVRLWYFRDVTFDDCDLGPARGRNAATIKAHCDYLCGASESTGLVVRNSRLRGSAPWIVSLGPPGSVAGECSEKVRGVTLDNLTFYVSPINRNCIQVMADNVTATNCRAIGCGPNTAMFELATWGCSKFPVGFSQSACSVDAGTIKRGE